MGNEFLRHFWASYGSNVKEKMEKNKRMVEQLKTTLTKIRKLLEIQLDDDELQKFQQSQTKLNVNGANSVSNGGGGGSLKLQKKILRPLIKSIEKALTLHREFNKRKVNHETFYMLKKEVAISKSYLLHRGKMVSTELGLFFKVLKIR
ncbi:8744_t:CDS:2 [Entrophospora sp. SA101]|nr:8744_t:CDS:2 [Entrophospora sp. SA101]